MPKSKRQINHTEQEYLGIVDSEAGGHEIGLFVKQSDGTYLLKFKLGEDPGSDRDLLHANNTAREFADLWDKYDPMGFIDKNTAEQALYCVQTVLGHKTTKSVKQLLPKHVQVTVPVLYDTAGNPTCQTSKKVCPLFRSDVSGFSNTKGRCMHGKGALLSRVPVKDGSNSTSFYPCESCPVHGKRGSATFVSSKLRKFLKEKSFYDASLKTLMHGLKENSKSVNFHFKPKQEDAIMR